MAKNKLGGRNLLFPMPVVLVGTMIDGRANFAPVAYVGSHDRKTVSIGVHRGHATAASILDDKEFSLNIPSVPMVRKVDFTGMKSGANYDKSELFEVFHGTLENTPMIEKCPVNLECKLTETIELNNRYVFMGEIVEAWTDDAFLTNGEVDLSRVDPLLFNINDAAYWRVSDKLGEAWDPGTTLEWEK
ncbi:flavin reductase family protein [bacterium]|nr:flavin reductase family protein [bacterium]